MSANPLAVFSSAAAFLGKLQRLRPGECIDARKTDMQDFFVPANPLDKQSPEYLAKWFADRLMFKCDYWQDIITERWTFCRPEVRVSSEDADAQASPQT